MDETTFGEIKRLYKPSIVFWVLCGAYLYKYFGQRDLFEYMTLLILWGYIQFDFKTKYKHFITICLIWNVMEEATLISGTQWIDLSTMTLLLISALLIYKTYAMHNKKRKKLC